MGLDIVVKERLLEAIREINKRNGTTVILTTHDMRDVEKICERLIIIDSGNIIYDGSLSDLNDQHGSLCDLTVKVNGVRSDSTVLGQLCNYSGVVDVKAEDNKIVVLFDRRHITAPVLVECIRQAHDINDFSLAGMPLEVVIKNIVGGKALS
jgi:ABC-2 type transport system ATP-binding protein